MAKLYSNRVLYVNPDAGNCNWDVDWYRNNLINDALMNQSLEGNFVNSGLIPSVGIGLQILTTEGTLTINNIEYTFTAQEIPLVGATVELEEINFVYVDIDGNINVTQDSPNENCCLIAIVDCDTTSVLRLIDVRKFPEVKEFPEMTSVNKNEIINGCFRIWQRNTTQTSNGYGSDDRFLNGHSGSTKTHSRQSFTAGQTEVPGEPKYYSRTVVATAATVSSYCFKTQRIESVRKLAGQNAILSFYARSDSLRDMAVEFTQSFGSSGSAAVTGIGVIKITLTSTWQKFEIPVSIPSIAGKTISGGDDYLGIIFWFEAGSNYDARTDFLGNQSGTFDLSSIKFEKGLIATEFIEREFQNEVSLCQRFYEKSYDLETNPGTATVINSIRASGASGSLTAIFFYTTPKRSIPSVINYDMSGGAGFVTTASGDGYGATISYSGTKAYCMTKAAQTILQFHVAADSEL